MDPIDRASLAVPVPALSATARRAAARGGIVLGPGFLGEAGRHWTIGRVGDVFSTRRTDRDAWRQFEAFCGTVPAEGAVVGYIAYDAAVGLEPTLRLPTDRSGLPAMWATRCDRLSVVSGDGMPIAPSSSGAHIIDGISSKTYADLVRLTIDAIRRGDIFQANISRELEARLDATTSPASLFERMISNGAAPFAAFLPVDAAHAVISNSPELFLSFDADHVTAEPIKGTRPRGATPAEDRLTARLLLSDEKDRAENIMIADLLRNDLSKVCADHTIREEEICALKTLPYVHHLYSRISGRLRLDKTMWDAVRAAFPCGSVTGAPKWRAMEIIAGIEGVGRGPYCGTIFVILPDQRAVFSVAIRTGVFYGRSEERLFRMRVGGGITVLSDPMAEYQETEDKAAPFRMAVS